MLDGMLGRKFSTKCKESVRCIKTRICFIRKKRQVTINILKKDVADLLANDHAANAFQRIDELLVEINKLSCYDMVEQFCDQIHAQLSTLSKQREECPEQEREAVATLIFAAARFHDLPELGRLRHNFLSRYSHTLSLDSCVNPLFVEKISGKTFTVDNKLKLMSEISEEFSVSWDVREFNKKNTHKCIRSTSDLAKTTMEMLEHEERQDEEVKDVIYTAKKEVTENKLTHSYGLHSFNYKDYRVAAAAAATTYDNDQTKEQPGLLSDFGSQNPAEKVNDVVVGTESKTRRNQQLGTEHLSPAREKRQLCMVPPPYVKPGKNRNATVLNAIQTESSSMVIHETDRNNSINITTLPEPESDAGGQTEKPKPTSVRTRRIDSKPRLPVDENIMVAVDSGCGGDRLDETRMDNILIHYSRKGMDHHRRRTKGKLKTSDRFDETKMDEILEGYSRKGMETSYHQHQHQHQHMMKEQTARVPERSLTFPAKMTADEHGCDEPTRTTRRATSMDSNVVPRVCHVHPRLPDYDELAATFNALKPTCKKKLSSRGI